MKNNFVVEKIGGTCMSQIDRVVNEIILNKDLHKHYASKFEKGSFPEYPYGRIFVVSAFGGVTDLLIGNKKDGSGGLYQKLMEVHKLDENKEQVVLFKEYLCGLGEKLAAYTLSKELKKRNVKTLIVRAGKIPETPISDKICIIPGHFLDMESGFPQLLKMYGRGYSDVTFSKVAVKYGLKIAVLHKEFPFSSADPKLIDGGKSKKIKRINHSLAMQLADVGMEAIHPEASRVFKKIDCHLHLREAFSSDYEGAIFNNSHKSKNKQVEIVSGHERVFGLEIQTEEMIGAAGFEKDIASIFRDHNISYIMKATDTTSITHIFLDKKMTRENKALSELRAIKKGGESKYNISFFKGSIVCIIGGNLDIASTLHRALEFFKAEKIEIKCLSLSLQRVNIQFVIDRKDYKKSINGLYNIFIRKEVEKK